MYELAAAIAATGREVELRGRIVEPIFEEICTAAGSRPILDRAPRLPRESDTLIIPEGWPDEAFAPYVLSGVRSIMMLLAPPGLAGWPYTGEPWTKPDPLTVDPEAVARPEHFRAIAGLGCEIWVHSRGLAAAAEAAGVDCRYIGSGQPAPFPQPGAKEHDLVVLEHNRWAPLALEVAERTGRSTVRVPRLDHAGVLETLGSARVLVWPSRVEGHSRVQVEARAMGTVPVALSSNRFAEGLAEEGGAVLVDSVEDMAPAIERLLDDPAELERRARLATDSARAHVDWDRYVERVDQALSAAAPAAASAAAQFRITRALALGEQDAAARLRDAERRDEPANPAAAEERGPGLVDRLRRGRRREQVRAPRPAAARTADRPTVYVVGGYRPRGGAYMGYHVGRIAAERFGYACTVVDVEDSQRDAGNGRWTYPEPFETVDRRQMEAEATAEDLVVAGPTASRYQFGLREPCRTLMYVQGFGSVPVLDGFYDAYVCASDPLREFVHHLYGIDAPVIPPFIHLDRIPRGPAWRERPPGRILVLTKSFGRRLIERLEEVMRRSHPAEARQYTLTVVESLPHDELLEQMSTHRYFLALSPMEGFGLPPLEAMAAGCAVVGFHGNGGTQYMRPGINCETVGYPAIEELSARLALVIGDPDHAERLAAAGRETAAEYELGAFERRWGAFLEGFLTR
jgi:glycosyltransferase involved in cell wall biosynthesis